MSGKLDPDFSGEPMTLPPTLDEIEDELGQRVFRLVPQPFVEFATAGVLRADGRIETVRLTYALAVSGEDVETWTAPTPDRALPEAFRRWLEIAPERLLSEIVNTTFGAEFGDEWLADKLAEHMRNTHVSRLGHAHPYEFGEVPSLPLRTKSIDIEVDGIKVVGLTAAAQGQVGIACSVGERHLTATIPSEHLDILDLRFLLSD